MYGEKPRLPLLPLDAFASRFVATVRVSPGFLSYLQDRLPYTSISASGRTFAEKWQLIRAQPEPTGSLSLSLSLSLFASLDSFDRFGIGFRLIKEGRNYFNYPRYETLLFLSVVYSTLGSNFCLLSAFVKRFFFLSFAKFLIFERETRGDATT